MLVKRKVTVVKNRSIKRARYIFLVMALGVTVVLYFLNSFTNVDMKCSSFSGLYGDTHLTTQTTYMYSHKEKISLEKDAANFPIINNKTSRNRVNEISQQQRQNRGNENKIIKTKVIQKHFLLCTNPTGRLGNQMFDFASSLGIANTLNYTFVMPSTHPLLGLFEINQSVLSKKPENLRTITLQQWRNKW